MGGLAISRPSQVIRNVGSLRAGEADDKEEETTARASRDNKNWMDRRMDGWNGKKGDTRANSNSNKKGKKRTKMANPNLNTSSYTRE